MVCSEIISIIKIGSQVELSQGKATVEYANDIDSAVYGSGFLPVL